MHEFKLGELFCGPGGLGQGARIANRTLAIDGIDAKIEHTWATDYHADSCATYRKNFPNVDPNNIYLEDVREFDLNKPPAFDALTFGFPCNDFSAVGEQKGFSGEFGPLYAYGVEMLRMRQPKWFLAENVSGIRTSTHSAEFEQILREMAGAGYVVTPHLYRFEEYGLPQARHRVIVVGIRADLDVQFRVPAPTHSKENYVTASDALMKPMPIGVKNNEHTRVSAVVRDRLDLTNPGENVFQMQARVGEAALESAGLLLRVKGATLSNIYKRLNPNRPAYTVTGSGGGGTHMYHWDEPRALTNRERARLQTFPDNHVFCGTKESVRRQIGMAVPPEGAARVFEAILKSFSGVEYPALEGANIASPVTANRHVHSQTLFDY
ncbi:DNA (cytosine-5-)-methyltransferase [Gulosibacter macacae]|uniref:Cytosine-specific methyltransferase n=1 Tax=Gulosibacter macacae TaxID=2488791 RepID=A0A3P3VT86_9MICO|nr:DNA (cytosine-5-)-methyltransferase [Gulosibacter macacae]